MQVSAAQEMMYAVFIEYVNDARSERFEDGMESTVLQARPFVYRGTRGRCGRGLAVGVGILGQQERDGRRNAPAVGPQ